MNKGNNGMMISSHDSRTSRIGRKKTAWSLRIKIVADVDLPSSMLGTMLKHGGGRATSRASKDGNNSSTLSLSLSL
jgi:hypothetical protein